jgi:predicted dinucleotide-binding enzyme
LILDNPDGSQTIGRPRKISKNPADIIPGADIVVLPLPEFSLESVLTEIKDYLRPGTIVMATPGGVFEWIARQALAGQRQVWGLELKMAGVWAERI